MGKDGELGWIYEQVYVFGPRDPAVCVPKAECPTD
jgi:hypothetical protein